MDAAIAAAKLCQAVRREIPVAMEKIDKSPVTVADYGSQALICKALKAAFPEDAIVGEEDATDLRSNAEQLQKVTNHVQALVPDATPEQVADWIDCGNGEVGGRFWTLDPIDGTKGFLRQDQYAVAIALIEDNEVKVGVMACPALKLESGEEGALFVAVRGEGATMQAISGGTWRSLQVVAADDVENMRFVESVEASHGDQSRQTSVAKAVGFTAESLRMDSQAKYGIVASGQAALYMRLPSPKTPDYRENIWDHAAGAIVVEEAGGRVTDMHGNSLPFGMGKKMVNNQGIVVSNGTIHDTVLKALKDS